ncbi:anticodon-binding aminoacyl-tRNA synthetase, class 1a [Tanacetum coccineum]|uniref:Anticodon-binding aminoacyl-tRNA synthetase, class 1a n=1 Tax=Tanacetum coccineum TaxID=301880 RepID=A0ABQ5CAP1_9ASTR
MMKQFKMKKKFKIKKCVMQKIKALTRWSLQKEIAKPFETALTHGFFRFDHHQLSYGGGHGRMDPDMKKAEALMDQHMLDWYRLLLYGNYLIESYLASALGFLHFKLSSEWIARSIHKMIKDGIDTWAPKLSEKIAIIYFWSRNVAKKMSMGHLRSIVIRERYSFPIGEPNDQAIGEPEGKSLYDPYISKTLDLSRGKGLSIDGEGVFIEGRKLPLADLAALWHALDMVKADWIVHVTDAAKHVGWIVTQHSRISHVGLGLVEGDDLERFVDLDDLLDEAKSRCKVVLVGQVLAFALLRVCLLYVGLCAYMPVCLHFCLDTPMCLLVPMSLLAFSLVFSYASLMPCACLVAGSFSSSLYVQCLFASTPLCTRTLVREPLEAVSLGVGSVYISPPPYLALAGLGEAAVELEHIAEALGYGAVKYADLTGQSNKLLLKRVKTSVWQNP